MHSFIDMMDDIIWTETDIITRTEAIIRKEFSSDLENILNRKTTAAMLGQYHMDESEQLELQRYSIICAEAQAAANQAREDNDFLKKVIDYEKADKIIESVRKHTAQEVSWATQVTEAATPEIMSLAGSRAKYKKLNS